jgi:hypothetical protein
MRQYNRVKYCGEPDIENNNLSLSGSPMHRRVGNTHPATQGHRLPDSQNIAQTKPATPPKPVSIKHNSLILNIPFPFL